MTSELLIENLQRNGNYSMPCLFPPDNIENMPINKFELFCDTCECVNHVFVFDFFAVWLKMSDWAYYIESL